MLSTDYMQQTESLKLSHYFAAIGCLPACMQNLTSQIIEPTQAKQTNSDRQHNGYDRSYTIVG